MKKDNVKIVSNKGGRTIIEGAARAVSNLLVEIYRAGASSACVGSVASEKKVKDVSPIVKRPYNKRKKKEKKVNGKSRISRERIKYTKDEMDILMDYMSINAKPSVVKTDSRLLKRHSIGSVVGQYGNVRGGRGYQKRFSKGVEEVKETPLQVLKKEFLGKYPILKAVLLRRLQQMTSLGMTRQENNENSSNR